MAWWQVILIVLDSIALAYFCALFVLMVIAWLAGYFDDAARAFMVVAVAGVLFFSWGLHALTNWHPIATACAALS